MLNTLFGELNIFSAAIEPRWAHEGCNNHSSTVAVGAFHLSIVARVSSAFCMPRVPTHELRTTNDKLKILWRIILKNGAKIRCPFLDWWLRGKRKRRRKRTWWTQQLLPIDSGSFPKINQPEKCPLQLRKVQRLANCTQLRLGMHPHHCAHPRHSA